MDAEVNQDHTAAAVDAKTAEWRQGDCVLSDDCWFAYRSEEDDIKEEQVSGLIVVSQTCDIVRGCTVRPFVDMCPLIQINNEQMALVRSARTPQYAYVPTIADKLLVADLDRTMSVQKSALVKWDRVPGWSEDAQIRAFADCLRRKSSRFAFPNDFVDFCGKLQARVKDKHGKGSDEGKALGALREIRVAAIPQWEAQQVDLMFWFIKGAEPVFEKEGWPSLLRKWLELIPAKGRFSSVDGQVATLAEMTAEDYVNSDILDLEHLSGPAAK